MEVTGKIKLIANEKSGVNQSTGKEWMMLDLIVTTGSGVSQSTGREWETNVKFDCFGDIAKAVKNYRNVGDEVRVEFNISADEYNEKWYNKLRPTRVELVSGEGSQVVNAQQPKKELDSSNNANATALFPEPEPSNNGADNLPF